MWLSDCSDREEILYEITPDGRRSSSWGLAGANRRRLAPLAWPAGSAPWMQPARWGDFAEGALRALCLVFRVVSEDVSQCGPLGVLLLAGLSSTDHKPLGLIVQPVFPRPHSTLWNWRGIGQWAVGSCRLKLKVFRMQKHFLFFSGRILSFSRGALQKKSLQLFELFWEMFNKWHCITVEHILFAGRYNMSVNNYNLTTAINSTAFCFGL